MKRERSRQGRWLPLLLMLVLGLLASPVAEGLASPRANQDVILNSNVYMTTATLKPLFQKEIDTRTGNVARTSIDAMTTGLTPTNRGWVSMMANALIKPRATVTDMKPQADGILTTISISLYTGDPFPTQSKMLIKFGILDPSTIQVSSQYVSGPKLVNDGPLTTLKVSLGKLKSIKTTPTCGESALVIGLQFSIPMNSSPLTARSNSNPSRPTTPQPRPTDDKPTKSGQTVDAYVEVPQASLDVLAQNIGKLRVSNTMRAQNLHVRVDNRQLIMTSDLSLWETGVIVASTTTTVQPGAQEGRLKFTVKKTDLTVAFFTFDGDSYNQQIETLLNQKLGSALDGKLTVEEAGVGNNNHVPCVADDSLLLKGKTNLE